MRFTLRDSSGAVTWEDGILSGDGPMLQASKNAFGLGDPFLLTPEGPEVVPDVNDMVSAYLTILQYAAPDAVPEDVPPLIGRRIAEMSARVDRTME